MTVFQPPPLFCFPLNTLCHHRRPVCGSWAQSRHRDGHGLVSDDQSRISAGGLTITFERRPHNPNPDQSPPPPPPPPPPPLAHHPPTAAQMTVRPGSDGRPWASEQFSSKVGLGLFAGGGGGSVRVRAATRRLRHVESTQVKEHAHTSPFFVSQAPRSRTPGGFHEMIRDLAWRGVESTRASRAPRPSSIQVCGNPPPTRPCEETRTHLAPPRTTGSKVAHI